MAEKPPTEQPDDAAVEGPRGTDREARAANLFDLRRIISGVLSLYGIILLILGLTQSHASIQKSAGTNVDLWSGAGMLVLGVLFIVWALWRPLGRELAQTQSEPPSGGTEVDR